MEEEVYRVCSRVVALYQDPELCGRPEQGQDVGAGELGTLPQEQQAGGGGRRGCEMLQGHHLTQGTWLGHSPSVWVSWHSFFHVKQPSQSSYLLHKIEEHRVT